MFNIRKSPQSQFEVVQYLRSKSIYYKQLSLKYEEHIQKVLKNGCYSAGYGSPYNGSVDFFVSNIDIPDITFVNCHDANHVWMKDLVLYRCINCGIERVLTECMPLPTDIVIKIFRMDASLFHLSRTTSKAIRNGSLYDIMQYELTYHISQSEILILNNPYCIIEKQIYENENYLERIYEVLLSVIPYINDIHLIYYCKYQCYDPCDGRDKAFKYKFGCRSKHNKKELKAGNYDVVLDVDFISYYKIILQRLQYYDCDRKNLAKLLTLKKFDDISHQREFFALFLYGIAMMLNIHTSQMVVDIGIITLLDTAIRILI